MRNAEERVNFKNHFFKLGQGRIIPKDHPDFWIQLWIRPTCSDDIYELFTAQDIRTVRDHNIVNFLLFIRILTERIIQLSQYDLLTTSDLKQLLNCIRFLTKLLPFLFELSNYLNDIEIDLFWNDKFDPLEYLNTLLQNEDDDIQPKRTVDPSQINNSLAVKLIQSLVDLLFIRGFTIESSTVSANSNKLKHLILWEPGIGHTSKYNKPNLIIECNRLEVLKLLTTLCTNSLYTASLPRLIGTGSKFLTILVATTPRVELLTLVCSLTNLVCRSSRISASENALVNSDSIEFTEARHLYLTYAFQLLVLMIVYPLPKKEEIIMLTEGSLISKKPYNMARLYMGNIHKDNELLFLINSLLNILRMNDAETYTFVKAGNQPSIWATETIMLIWELLQCNKHFRELIGKKFISELMVLLVYYISNFYSVAEHKDLVSVCAYLLLYLSSELEILQDLYFPISSSLYDSFPQHFKLPTHPFTTRDFIVSQICNLLINSIARTSYLGTNKQVPDLVLKALVEILYNLIPPVSDQTCKVHNDISQRLNNPNVRGGLSYATSNLIIMLLSRFLSRTFILDKPFNSSLVALLIRAIAITIVKHPIPSRMLLYAILKNETVFDDLRISIGSLKGVCFNGNHLEKIDNRPPPPPQILQEPVVQQLSPSPTATPPVNPTLSISPEVVHPQIQPVPAPLIRQLSPQNNEELPVAPSSESESIELSLRPKPPIGMSESAREKMRKLSPITKTWGGNEGLRIIISIIIPYVKSTLKSMPIEENLLVVQRIEAIDFAGLIDIQRGKAISMEYLPETPFEPLRFSWGYLSLGWYMSLLYHRIYKTNERVRAHVSIHNNRVINNISASVGKFASGWTSLLKTTIIEPLRQEVEESEWVKNSLTIVNHWENTKIKLLKFDVQSTESFFTSSMNRLGSAMMSGQSAPGSVHDMTTTLIRKFSDFKVRNNSSPQLSINPTSQPTGDDQSYPVRPRIRNSVTSLYSLNNLNRTRSGSISRDIGVNRTRSNTFQ